MEFKCSICLGSLFSVNTDVSVIQCGHMYHKTCLEGSWQNSPNCPNCRSRITSGVERIYPDVFDDLVYNGVSNKTKEFLEEICGCEKEKRKRVLKIIEKLDKENINLKETNKSNHENIQTCKVFLKSFQKERKEWQQKNKTLELENNSLLDELRKQTKIELVINVFKDSQLECGNKIEKSSSKDSSGSTIQTLVKEGLLSFHYLFNQFFFILKS